MKEEDQSAGSSGTPLEWGLTQSTPALNSPLYVSSVAPVSSEATILCNMGSFEFGESISTLNLRAIIYYYCVPSTSSNGSVFFFFFSSSGLGPFLSVCRMHEQLPQGEKPVMMLGAQLHVAKFQLQMSLVASHSQCFSAQKDFFSFLDSNQTWVPPLYMTLVKLPLSLDFLILDSHSRCYLRS